MVIIRGVVMHVLDCVDCHATEKGVERLLASNEIFIIIDLCAG